MKIDIEKLKSIIRSYNSKKENWDKNEHIKKEMPTFYEGIREWYEKTSGYKSYGIACIMVSIYRWITAEKDNKKRLNSDKTKRPKPVNYEPREIILADLGGTNCGVEASYEHPAVVVHNGYYFLLVVPCSTGRLSKSDYILNAGTGENFERETGVQIDQIRIIDKSRVVKRNLGKVPPAFMNDINNAILEKYLNPVHNKIKKLEKENKELKEKLSTALIGK